MAESPSTDSQRSIRIDPLIVMRINMAIVAFLALLNIAVWNFNLLFEPPIHGFLVWLQTFVSMDLEQNLPTWFVSILAASCGALFAAIAIWNWKNVSRLKGANWTLLAIAAFMVSLDEFTVLHERVGGLLMRQDFTYEIPVLYVRPWTIAALTLLPLLLLVLLPFLRTLPRKTLSGLVAAGFVYASGAVGVELITAEIYRSWDWPSASLYMPALEESLEMLGFVVLQRVLLDHMAEHGPAIVISTGQPASGETTA